MARCTVQNYADIDCDALLDTGRIRRAPVMPWCVVQTAWEPQRAQYWETLFALSNGLTGLRGTLEEDDEAVQARSSPGMYLNGIYDYEPYEHLWYFPGFATHKHAMLNCADWRIINLYVNCEHVRVGSEKLVSSTRTLDMRQGVVKTSLRWNGAAGPVDIVIQRLVSMTRRYSAVISYAITPVDADADIVIESVVDEQTRTSTLKEQEHIICQERRVHLRGMQGRFATREAPFVWGMAVEHRVRGCAADVELASAADSTRTVWRFHLHGRRNRTVTLDKHACFFTSVETPAHDVLRAAHRQAQRDARDSFAVLTREQRAFWRRYWRTADIAIDGAPADQQAVRFSLFHLRQSHPEDPRRSISANGMTGDHHCGHVFWDTEMYMLPHFLYTEPAIAKPLLMYRYHLLDKARERAKEMGGTGAMFAWNAISGEECGVVFEASTAEYHLQSAIPFAIARYIDATNDAAFLREYGAEIICETARYMAGRGAYIPHKGGLFCINAVCGPDEYGCGVNNNCYTNMLCQWHLRYAVQVCCWLRATYPEH